MKTLTTTYRLHSIIAAVLVGASAFGLTAVPAAADSLALPLQVTVKFADLDITRSQGATVLFGRIRAAAESVCSPFDRGDRLENMEFAACVKKSIADAVSYGRCTGADGRLQCEDEDRAARAVCIIAKPLAAHASRS